jgi:predicted nucleic acid-binding protein
MTILTTNLVLAEVHRLLLFRAGMRPALAALDRIEASPLVRIEFPGDAHHRAARAWLEKFAGHSVTYTDAVRFAVMDSSKCSEVATFDRDFEIAGFELLPMNQ